MGCVIAPDQREDHTVELILLRRQLPVAPFSIAPKSEVMKPSPTDPLSISTVSSSACIDQFGLQAGGLWYSYRPQAGLECVRLGFGTPIEITPGVSFPVHSTDDAAELSNISSGDYGRYLALQRKYSNKSENSSPILGSGKDSKNREGEQSSESAVILRRIRLGRVVGDVLSKCTTELMMLEEWQPIPNSSSPVEAVGNPPTDTNSQLTSSSVSETNQEGLGRRTSASERSWPSDKDFCLSVMLDSDSTVARMRSSPTAVVAGSNVDTYANVGSGSGPIQQASLLSAFRAGIPLSTSPVTPQFVTGGRKVPISPHCGRSRGNSFLTASGSEDGSRSPQDLPNPDGEDRELAAVTPTARGGSTSSAAPMENGNLASIAFFGPKSPACRKSPSQRHLEVEAATTRRRQKANSFVDSTGARKGPSTAPGSEADLCIVVPFHPEHEHSADGKGHHAVTVRIVPPHPSGETGGRVGKRQSDAERFLAPLYRSVGGAKPSHPQNPEQQPFTPVVAPPLHFTEVGDLLGLISTWLEKDDLKQARRVSHAWKEHMDPCFIHRVISRSKKNSLEFDIEDIRHTLSEQRRWSVKLILAIILALVLCCGTIAFSLMATGIFSIAIVIFYSIIMFGFRFLYSYWGLTVYPNDPTFMVTAEQLRSAPTAYLTASRLAPRNRKKSVKDKTPICECNCDWFKGRRRLSVWRMLDAMFFLVIAGLSYYAITLGLEHAYEYLWTDDPVYPAECILTYDEQIDSDGPSYLTFTDPYRWQVIPQLGFVQHSFSGDSVVDYFIVAQYLGDFFEPGVVKDGYLTNSSEEGGMLPDLSVPAPVPPTTPGETADALDQVRKTCKWYSPMHTMNWTAPLQRGMKAEDLQSDRWWAQVTLNRPMIALQVNSMVASPDMSATNMTQLEEWFWTLMTTTEGQPLQATLALQKQDVLQEYLTWKFNCPMFCHGIPLLNGVVGIVDTSQYLRNTLIALSFVGAAIVVGGVGRIVWFQYAVVRPTRVELRRLQALAIRLAEAQVYLSQFRGDHDGLDSSRSPSTSLGSPTPTSPSSTKAFPAGTGKGTAIVPWKGARQQTSASPDSAGRTSTSLPTPSPGIGFGTGSTMHGRLVHPASQQEEPSSPFESSSPMPAHHGPYDRSQTQPSHQPTAGGFPFGGPASPSIPRAGSVDGPAFEFIPTGDDSPSPFHVELGMDEVPPASAGGRSRTPVLE